jgi:hypothetical protein
VKWQKHWGWKVNQSYLHQILSVWADPGLVLIAQSRRTNWDRTRRKRSRNAWERISKTVKTDEMSKLLITLSILTRFGWPKVRFNRAINAHKLELCASYAPFNHVRDHSNNVDTVCFDGQHGRTYYIWLFKWQRKNPLNSQRDFFSVALITI